MKKTVLWSLIILTIIGGIVAGILVHVYNDERMKQAMIEYVNAFNEEKREEQEQKEIIRVSTSEEKTSPNAELIFSIYYAKCGHIEVKRKEIENEDVNKTEKELQEKYKDWVIKKFNPNEIELYQEQNTMCKNHYIVRENDGFVTVYLVDENGEETLKEKTEISTKYLPEEDIELLKKGIKANSNIELQQILSDYE